ncbi:MAG: hypothetical protein OXQ32_12775 [bacterium]|nr:hypothetical protein [bacterium]
MFRDLLVKRGWELNKAWLAIAVLLMTCEIWRDGRWRAFHDAPVLRESNDYGLTKAGAPNRALKDAFLVRQQLSHELDIDPTTVCHELGRYFQHPAIIGLQPNNPRGHAFRSLVAETVAHFGDRGLDVIEEESPHTLFPGYAFGSRSRDARIDIAVKRDGRPVALITTRWTYRHDRVDIIEEALAYVHAARAVNNNCRFFGVTSEFGTARLKKVLYQTEPLTSNAAINRLVHLNPKLPGPLISRNGVLRAMWSLEQMVHDSYNWT